MSFYSKTFGLVAIVSSLNLGGRALAQDSIKVDKLPVMHYDSMHFHPVRKDSCAFMPDSLIITVTEGNAGYRDQRIEFKFQWILTNPDSTTETYLNVRKRFILTGLDTTGSTYLRMRRSNEKDTPYTMNDFFKRVMTEEEFKSNLQAIRKERPYKKL